MPAALSKRMDVLVTDSRTLLRDKNLRHSGISRTAQGVEIRLSGCEMGMKAFGIKLKGSGVVAAQDLLL
jgi:preprotein translocase subunit SecD